MMNTTPSVPGRALTDYLYSMAARNKIPLNGTFELSPVCNFACRMCYVRKTAKEVRESERPILTLEDWRRIAREARDAGMLDLLLTGGEPLLWPDFWTLYEELIDMGFQVSINTNGSLIDDRAVARFAETPPQRLNITLYGACYETYENLCGVKGVFSKVDRGIRALKAAGITVKLNCSLTPHNAHDLDRIIDYAQEQDLILSLATYMFPPVRRDESLVGVNERFTPEEASRYLMHWLRRDRGEERYQKYLRAIADGCAEPPGLDESCIDPTDGKIRCRAGKAAFWITWDGWMTPCGMMTRPRIDVRKQSFAGSWQLLTEATEAVRLSGICDQCPNRRVCHPCAAMAQAETGESTLIPAYLCESTREKMKIAQEELSEIMK